MFLPSAAWESIDAYLLINILHVQEGNLWEKGSYFMLVIWVLIGLAFYFKQRKWFSEG